MATPLAHPYDASKQPRLLRSPWSRQAGFFSTVHSKADRAFQIESIPHPVCVQSLASVASNSAGSINAGKRVDGLSAATDFFRIDTAFIAVRTLNINCTGNGQISCQERVCPRQTGTPRGEPLQIVLGWCDVPSYRI